VKFIGVVNDRLSVQQKEYITGTPFLWFTMLNDSVKISKNFLSHLCFKWVERRGGFDVGGQVT